MEVAKMEKESGIKISGKGLASYAMLIVAVLLLVVSVVQAYQIASIGKAENTDASSVLDTAGWTEDEKMNYEMHGIIPARVKSSSSSASSAGMVGGC